ncbi:RHS repeat-associated core domain-containing protein [Micromonospora sp. WMMD956]|uniref:RHS repeat-associated core domain-containing protein n=1 Tax=Micromonospora sp. WMMD956 TaxID=3016108 RepID=UPI002415A1FF|nr:RHS repeat-associated core domain-containing protein [Micromonospora sp. WMMD956]MDG4820173.1 RHS repeat-associated core domain-containing protein [Micromonospora sp. WMMD956]
MIVLAMALATVGGQIPAQARPEATAELLKPQRYESVPVHPVRTAKPAPDAEAAPNKIQRPSPVWPVAGTAEVTLPATEARATTSKPVRAGSLPVAIAPSGSDSARRPAAAVPGKVRVQVLPQATAERAGLRGGLLIRVGRTDGGQSDGQVEVTVDYSTFASAFGADWSSRVRLVRVPECALTSPEAKNCLVTPLESRNAVRDRTVSASVPAGPIRPAMSRADAKRYGTVPGSATSGTLIALMAGPSGGAGSFTASSLAPSSSWSHGGSTGGFNWSYPMRTPPGPGGPAPSLALSYSSQAVDGRQAATNNQPGMIGEGFDYSPGFIERQYKACADDMDSSGANNTVKTGDLCWGPDNAVMSLGGSSVELLKGSDGKWHPRREDGSKIELLTSPVYNNGDDDNEYWKVTTADGTQYWFGRHQLPGWSTSRPTTNSVLTVPVYGNNPGEPCHQSTFAASECGGKRQAWRWNLDYVQDVHGNTMSLWWSKETNYYAKNKASSTPVAYDRAGYLTRIDYGTDNRDNTEYAAASPYVQNAPMRVAFTYADRCLANCTTKNDTTWPDTPWDQECTASTNPCQNGSPTFWSAKRTTVITTSVWKAALSKYQPADSWTLRQSFPDPGDGTRAGLWLEGITHRGLNDPALITTPNDDTKAVVAPEVTFEGIQMQNRVDATGSDWALAMNWRRVNLITLETGGQIFVTYSDRQCAKGGTMPSASALDSNTLLCYPVRWTPPAFTDPITDYFHKYVVREVQQIDPIGGARPLRTSYEYSNPGNQPLWHYDEDNGLAPDNRKSWSQWRGYPKVTTNVGEGTNRVKTETLYYRGMYGDKLAGGGTRTSTVEGLEGGAVNDYDHYAGTPREQISWLGSTVLAASINDMWRSAATATRAGTPIAEARYSRVTTVHSRATTDTGVRRASTTTTYGDYGMPTTVQDNGDDDKTGDEACVQTEYARNTTGTNWLLTPVKRTHGWIGTCATTPTAASQITADTKFSFDTLAYGTTPTKGLPTKTEAITGFSGGTRTYQQKSTAVYDARGRMTESTDVAGQTTTTTYTPLVDGPVTKVETKNPLLWSDIVDLDPVLGLPIKATDPNLRITEYTYDAMGRNTAVWLPDRDRAANPSAPSTRYSYQLRKTQPSTITTESLNANGGYDTSHVLLDGLGRGRQTQEPAYGAGRILTDTFYDAAGRVYKANSAYWNNSPVDLTEIRLGNDYDVPSQTQTLFDVAGRPLHSLLLAGQNGLQVEKSRTSITYHGDHTTTEPAQGEAAITTWTDVQGRVEKLWQYHSHTAAGTYDETSYTYHPTGQLSTVADASGNTWSYTYDIQGRPVSVNDPDQGTSTMAYNTYGDLEKTTDSRPDTPDLYRTYDQVGRLETVREGSLTGQKRIGYTYDSPVKGVVKSASRFIGTDEYRDETVTVDKLYRPTQTKLTLPASQAGFCGIGATTCSFVNKATFKASGALNNLTLPAAGGLSQEVLTHKYDTTYGMPNQLATDYGDASYYAIQSGYTSLFELNTITRATALAGAKFLQSATYYDEATGRAKSSSVSRSTSPGLIANIEYAYDPSGNLKKIDDNPGSGTRDTQCFIYDHQRRLTQAWTPESHDCATPPQNDQELGGPAPYWQQWSFGAPTDPKGRIGNRLTQTERATPTGTITTTYNYPNPQAAQPHALLGWSRTDNTGTTTGSYSYDNAGNMTSRPSPSGQQTMTWDAEGHLATLTDSAGANSYIYDASGNRLIATDPTGSTLFLDGQEVRRNTSTGQVDATRYYTFNGETIAQRTVTGLTWLASDYQGTAQLSVATDTNQTITQRRQTPYGTPRGPQPTWPNQQGFLGGFKDPTGLTHLGAREYDPTIGRFISVDPINDPGNPRQLPAYTYAANNPITYSDPSGEIIPEYGGVDTPTGLCEHGLDGYACQEDVEGGGSGNNGAGPARKTGSQKTHESLEACGLFLPVGMVCDGVNAAIYVKEGNYTEAVVAGVSTVPVLDWACKIKSFCKATVGWMADRVKSVVGKAPTGPAPKINHAADAREMAAIKADARSAANQAPAPKPPKPPTKEPGPTTRGKPSNNGGGGAPTAKSGCAKHSFDPATPVLMADGSSRPIAEVTVGDAVLAHNPETGTTSPQAVVEVHVNRDKDLTDLSVRIADGSFSTLKTTGHHPIWSESRNGWVAAADLMPTERLKTSTGTIVTVVEARSFSGDRMMNDLTVATFHTYYVIVDNTSILVHNCGGSINPSLVRFSQDTVSPRFSTGETIEQTAAALRSGYTRPTDLPPVRLTVRDGQIYTLDNRRLVAFQKAGIPMPFRMATPEEAANEAWKFTTKNEGRSIIITHFDPVEWIP